MSRVNIGEAYNRLKYSASNTPVADQLKEELIRLRKSTRSALQQSWDEVETLQKQCAINTEVIAEHDTVIADMKKKEKSWQIRCRAAEAQLQDKSEDGEPLQGNSRVSFTQSKDAEEKERDPLPDHNKVSVKKSSSRLRRATFTFGESKLEDMPQRVTPRHHKRFSLIHSARSWVGRHDDDQKEMPIELVLKLHSRDEAISSLEQTLDENIKSMQCLQNEIQSLVVTQKMKEKKICDSHAQKEEDFKGQVESLRKELSMAMSRNAY